MPPNHPASVPLSVFAFYHVPSRQGHKNGEVYVSVQRAMIDKIRSVIERRQALPTN
jgi:hypothetical protein